AEFGRFLAAYFENLVDYWQGRPAYNDPEELLTLNDPRRAWTFEVRFEEGLSVHKRTAWCATEAVMTELRRLQDAQEPPVPGDEPSPVDRFLQGVAPLSPAGDPNFCETIESW